MTNEANQVHTKTICCFAGPRPQSLPFGEAEGSPGCLQMKQLMRLQAIHMIEDYGVTHFISTFEMGVGQYGAEIVLDLKKQYPDITLECAIAYEMQAEKWTVEQRERYFTTVGQCDMETLLQRHYTRDCRRKRIEYMAAQSHYCIAVWNGRPGEIRSLLSLIHQQGKPAFVIDPNTLLVYPYSCKA